MNLSIRLGLLIIAIAATPPCDAAPLASTRHPLEEIVIPLAPFLTRDSAEKDAITALRYVERMSREIDVEGRGIPLTIRIHEPKQGKTSHPFRRWTDGNGVAPGELGLPAVREVPFIEYVAYVTKAMDWRYEVRSADVLITRSSDLASPDLQ